MRRLSPKVSRMYSSSLRMTSSRRSGRARMSLKIADLLQQLLEFGEDLVLLEPGEPVEPHFQDRLRLDFRQPIAALDDAQRPRFRPRAGC